jgi:hypothetical protein
MLLGIKKPKLAVLPYRPHKNYKFVLDLRAFANGRKFFKTRSEINAERLRQLALRKTPWQGSAWPVTARSGASAAARSRAILEDPTSGRDRERCDVQH